MEVKKIVERKRAKHANWKASQLLEAKREVKRKSRQKSKTNLNVDSQNGGKGLEEDECVCSALVLGCILLT